MDRKVFYLVAGAIVFASSGRDVETGVVRNVRQAFDEPYPFIDGLRIKTERPSVSVGIGTSDLEERDIDKYPFIDGLRKIPRRFGLPEIDLEEGSAAGNDDGFPFRDESIETAKPREFDLEDTPVGNDGFPFRNGVRRHSTTTQKNQAVSKVEDFQKTDEKYPFVNGLRKYNSHPIKKRAVGALADSTEFLERRREISRVSLKSAEEGDTACSPTVPDVPMFSSAATVHDDISHNDVHRFAPGKSPNHQTRGTPKATRFKISYGQRKESDTKLYEKVTKKPIQWGVSKVITQLKFPEGDATNKCTISYIVVRNAQTIGDLDDDDVSLVSGGIGETSVVMKITSHNFYLYSYRIVIYGECL